MNKLPKIIYQNPYPQDSWEARFETLMLIRRGEILYPLFFHEAATLIGNMRESGNKEMNDVCHKYTRGDRSDTVNILGIVGEMIGQYLFFHKGIPFKSTNLYSATPLHEPDIIIKNYGLDFKGVRPDGWDFLVNEEAHNNIAKGVTHYVHIQASEGSAKYWIHSCEEVNEWKIKKVGYSNAYFLPIKDFRL